MEVPRWAGFLIRHFKHIYYKPGFLAIISDLSSNEIPAPREIELGLSGLDMSRIASDRQAVVLV